MLIIQLWADNGLAQTELLNLGSLINSKTFTWVPTLFVAIDN